jgi:DNA topoisomerase VI subunit B
MKTAKTRKTGNTRGGADRTASASSKAAPTRRAVKLERETFVTSRLLDFCSEKELSAQTGHRKAEWPLVALKELLDNSIDACEDKGIDPVVTIQVDEHGLSVSDNGPGIPTETVKGVLDFTVRVSSRDAYVSPTRGAQGNALKTLVMMPYVLDGTAGSVEIESRGTRHEITVGVDQVRQHPSVSHRTLPVGRVKTGTCVRLLWPDSSSSILKEAKARFLQIAEDYIFLNPHLGLTVSWFGEICTQTKAFASAWPKWHPSDPTSPCWYEAEHMERYVGACITSDEQRGNDRTVREFIAGFAGLSGTAKQSKVLEATGLTRTKLSALANDGRLDKACIAKLLDAMRRESKQIKPLHLGVLGREFLQARFETLECEMETFRYRRQAAFNAEKLPYVLEAAFAWRPPRRGTEFGRRTIVGVNWSPGIVNPFRQIGSCGPSLDALLAKQRADSLEPVVFLLHVACPRVTYTDRGKSAVVVPGEPLLDNK